MGSKRFITACFCPIGPAAILGMAILTGRFQKQVDQASHDLRSVMIPAHPGCFKAIRLRGRCESRRGDRTFEPLDFEIVLEGPDHYYRHEWIGERGQDGWQSLEQLVLPEFECRRSETVAVNYGRRGGSNSSHVHHGLIPAVARRIWSMPGQIGVNKNSLLYGDERYREEFEELKSYRGIVVPRRIVWKDYDVDVPGTMTTYTIEKVEILRESQKPLFESVRKRIAPKR